jgi:hypothetical protein
LCLHLLSVAPEGRSVITPYLHALLLHVPAMLEQWGSLAKFSTSAQELKNQQETMGQFRGTNQHHVPTSLLTRQIAMLYFLKIIQLVK